MKLQSYSHHGRRGSVLLMGAVISTIVSIVVVAFLSTALRTERWNESQARERRLEYAAENAVAAGFNELWSDFQATYSDRRRAHWDFKTFLSDEGLADQSAAEAPQRASLLGRLNLPRLDGGAGDPSLGGVRVESLEAWREDGPVSVRLHVRAQVAENAVGPNAAPLRRTVHKAFHIEGQPFVGLDYALLANNINCLMCHTEVDNARRFFNEDPTARGTFERVKVGSLESFQLRESPESWVAGTVYLAGTALDDHGDLLEDWDDIAFKGRDFDEYGELVEDAFGDLHEIDLLPADAANPLPLENLYLGYNDDPEGQVDGYLPDLFPSPFPDDGGVDPATGLAVEADAGNRVVDDSEFASMTGMAIGSISGGTIGVLEPGKQISTMAGLESLRSGTTDTLAGVTEGNVVLHGTKENPIVLDGEVAIQGDLILSGYVVGDGSLRVSGNVYVPSDLQYLDGTTGGGDRTFGYAADGEPNSLSLASGGNVSIGDIFRPEWGEGDPITGNPGGSFSFIVDELANFNRMEWIKTQEQLPGKTVKKKVGEKKKKVKKWKWVPYYTWVDQPVYKKINGYKVKVGTKKVKKKKWKKVGPPWWEWETKPIYEKTTPSHSNPYYAGPEYVPRYYSFSEGTTVPIFNKKGHFDPDKGVWLGDERAGSWNSGKLTYADPNNGKDKILHPKSGPQPVVSSLTATDGWLSNDVLQQFLSSEMAARDGSTLKIDGTIYSNNSIFGMVPSVGSPGSNGKLQLNGSIVAADVGLLAPGGTQLNYDDRDRNRLRLTADTNVRVRRHYLIPGS